MHPISDYSTLLRIERKTEIVTSDVISINDTYSCRYANYCTTTHREIDGYIRKAPSQAGQTTRSGAAPWAGIAGFIHAQYSVTRHYPNFYKIYRKNCQPTLATWIVFVLNVSIAIHLSHGMSSLSSMFNAMHVEKLH